ncbi:MAG: glycosyltransferase [bacterium]
MQTSPQNIKSPKKQPRGASLELSVIIVNYNVKDFLEQTLVSVMKSLQSITGEIIVVDNASHDGSVNLLREKFPQVKLIENQTNVGFSRASNQGLRAAQGEYLVLLNPDTVVQEDTFTSMLAFYKRHPDTGMLGCKILNPDGSLQLACRRSFPTPWIAFTKLSGLSYLFPRSKLFGKYNLTYLNPDQPCEVDAISGSFMMIRNDILTEVGFLDEAYFMYGEDLDWCFRIRAHGWKVRYFPGTKIIHFKGESSKRSQFDHLKVFYQAMSLFVSKHFKNKYFFMPYWLLWVAIWLRAGFAFLVKSAHFLAAPLVDFGLLSLSIITGVFLRYGGLESLNSFVPIILACAFICLGLLYHFGSYDQFKYSFSKASFAIFTGFLIMASLLFFFKQFAYSRFVVLIGGILSFIAVPGWRFALKLLPRTGLLPFKGTLGKTLLARNTLIVGDLVSGARLIKKFNSQIEHSYHLSGLVSLNGKETGQTYDGVEVLGSVEDLHQIVKAYRIQEVIFSTSELSYHRILSLISSTHNQHVNFKLVPSNLDVIIGKASIDRMDDVPLLHLDYKLHQKPYRLLKRTCDLLLALVLSTCCLPIFLVKKILLGSNLVQKKIAGPRGQVCTIYVFENKRLQSFNKIPYLWSILKGDLSFVGPEMVEIEEQASSVCQNELDLLPGLTGLVQINRHRELSPDDIEKYHLYYLKNYSPLLDLEIIFKSIFKI